MKFVIHADPNGRFKWRLVSSTGKAVASSSDSFGSRADAREAAEDVKARTGGAEVVDA
jgi:uncharacterized protein YegP (UPF0339 family)